LCIKRQNERLFGKNFIDVNIEEEFNQKIVKYSDVLNDLNNAVIECNEKLEGNVFYENDSYGVFNVLEIFKNKRLNLYQLAKTSSNILEIGFNAGHSTLIYLIANDTSTIQLFDLNDHKYTEKCFDILNNHFPGRLSIVYGDSTKTVKTFKNSCLFDMIHIDGGHTRTIAEKDFFNCKRLSSGVVIVDDANADPTKSLVEMWLRYSHVHMVKQPYNSEYHFIGKY
jgi:predicted O-methyltransferase YrrM